MLPAAARSRLLGLLAAPYRLESIEIVAAFPLTRGRIIFIRSPRGSGTTATTTLGGIVICIGRLRRGGGEVWVVVVVVVTAESAGAPEAYKTLPRLLFVPATFLLFGRSSGTSFSSYSSIEGLRLLLRLIYNRLSLLLASILVSSVFSVRLYFPNYSSTTSSNPLVLPIGPLFLLLLVFITTLAYRNLLLFFDLLNLK
jgi:hypothetical protein